ncbi:MAG: L-serine ammonia-lyase [Clostridiales bacterium]|nr:L-serine ammonia-lyase [Clostridiales bacterium]
MKSIRQVYKIGRGPSSSHTMGPEKAARQFAELCPEADSFEARLYGSLAKTGKGHKTDCAIANAFSPRPVKVIFNTDSQIELPHQNTMDFEGLKNGKSILKKRYLSIGGGDIIAEGEKVTDEPEVYKAGSFAEISSYCKSQNIRLSEYVRRMEGDEIFSYLAKIWDAMQQSVFEGLSHTGILQGGLGVERRAQQLYNQRHMDESKSTYETRIVCSYAFAASEQNADGGRIVTAPTCGSCGVVPAVLKYYKDEHGYKDKEIINALAVGGLIGSLVKANASISGAECGCQAEIGTACAMAAAALAELFGMGIDQIEYSAEIAIEHHLGLTCDPIYGLVQIPCIERNAVAAMRAINAVTLANFLTFTRKISLDLIIKTMYDTGKDMNRNYRETADGGLAKLYVLQ